MARKPTKSHPLRTARNILGLTQKKFGASVGTSAITIQQIENGLAQMSPGLARRISIIHDLDPKQLMSGEDPEHPRLVFSKQLFTKEYAEGPHRTVNPEERREMRTRLLFVLDLLFDAADDLGRYHAFLYSVHEELEQRAILMKVITYTSPRGEKINLSKDQVRWLTKLGEWPRDSRGIEFLWIYEPEHEGEPTYSDLACTRKHQAQ